MSITNLTPTPDPDLYDELAALYGRGENTPTGCACETDQDDEIDEFGNCPRCAGVTRRARHDLFAATWSPEEADIRRREVALDAWFYQV